MVEGGIKSVAAFDATFNGPEGEYDLSYRLDVNCYGFIDVEIAGISMRWAVDVIREEVGQNTLCGITSGSTAVWHDVFWFEIVIKQTLTSIRYWGDRVVWREDSVIAP